MVKIGAESFGKKARRGRTPEGINRGELISNRISEKTFAGKI
jgi:hypothetical protein